jgi:hypothetical protein
MAVTRITDIITPENWRDYGLRRSTELSAFWQSGVVANVDGVALPQGGGTVNMPHFNPLTGDAEVLADDAPLTPANIGTGKQVAVVLGRGRAWGANDLAGLMAGADPARAIMDQIAQWWASQYQKDLLATLKGYLAAASMSGNVHDISAGAAADDRTPLGTHFADAAQKLGDAKSQLQLIAMHSATETFLQKKEMLIYERPSEAPARVAYFQGRRVIVDDTLPVATGTYTTYLFGPGAVGYVDGVIGPSDVEQDRDILAGDDYIAMRRRLILHPKGARWQGTPAGDFPTRTELETGTNWLGVFDTKQVPVVAFKHKLA